ncbi:MAG: fibronectin type III domain-containing protein [Bacteroidetes bacterium]|nr:fibronectin type III domain-containing protein [Bacteroidota bacterium]
MTRRIVTVAFCAMVLLFSRVYAQPQSAAHQHNSGSGVDGMPAAPILVLTQNASALDTEEQKVTTFLSTQGFVYDVTDAIGLSTLNAADYPLIIFRTGSEPASYDNGAVLSEIRDAVETAGVTLMVENYGSYLAAYLGWGTVSSKHFLPVVLDRCAFVAPITQHEIFDGITTWDPPTPPDDDDQILWEILTPTGGSGVRIESIPDEVAIESWHLLITPGWKHQPTNSTYCQSWGGCTSERSVHIDRDQTFSIKYVQKGYGQLYFSAPVGFGGGFATNAPVVVGKAGMALKQNIVRWGLRAVKPDPPSNLTATAVSPTRVQLIWVDNSNYETRFVIEKESNPGMWVPVDTAFTNITSHIVVNLQPETEHSFRVRAANWKYESDPTNVASAVTPPFPAPTDLQAEAVSSDAVQLSWEDRSTNESGFIVEIKQSTGVWDEVAAAAANATSHVVLGLQPSTTYTFRLKAVEGIIASPASNEAMATTWMFLQAPTNLTAEVLSETEVLLQWEDHADGEENYEVQEQHESGGWSLVATLGANAEKHGLQGLVPRTHYRFRVRAIGTNAASSWSNVVEVLTKTKPAAPLEFTCIATDHQTVAMTWLRGSENEEGYEIERKTAVIDWEIVHTAGPGDGDLKDEHLQASTVYWYRARAVNDVGTSVWVEDTAVTYPMPVPDIPFGLRAEADGPTSITLTWVMPSPSYAISFEIEQSLTGDENDFSRISPDAAGRDRAYTVAGLDPETEYCFRIRAVNLSGVSGYSTIECATTQGSDDPFRPFNLTAVALGETEIRITWEMPDPSNEDGFELQRSLSGAEGDFTMVTPEPAQGSRQYLDTELAPGTTYFYRLRSYNSFGFSAWTDTVSATTQKEVLTPELRAAIEAKQQVIGKAETLIPEGGTEMRALRSLLGDYARGYDESAATNLITEWSTTGASDPVQATKAMERYTLFEEALLDSWGDDQASPPVTGMRDLGSQCGRIPAIATKNLLALALAWKEERDFLPAEEPNVDAAMEDLILALSDNTCQLLALMSADQGGELTMLTDDIIRSRGEVQDVTSGLMLSLTDYWQEHLLGRYYLRVTQPLIAEYAHRTEQLDFAGTQSEAEAKRDAILASLRVDIDALSAAFGDYYRIGSNLDKAYAIEQSAGADAAIFLLRLTGLRTPLTDNMYAALADAVIPTQRFLYMTSPDAVPGLGSVPSALASAGEAIFDPTQGGIVQGENPLVIFRKAAVPVNNPVIDADFVRLQELRAEVQEGDTQYISDEFDALRRSGREMVAEITSLQRPLLGVDRAALYGDEALRSDYYYTLARMQLLKTRRAVLSVALADYIRTPTSQKQVSLVAEIDSIIGPFENVGGRLADLISAAGSIRVLPVLSIESADIVRDEAGGPKRCRIRFDVKNVGGADADIPTATLGFLSSGLTVVGNPVYSFATLQPDGAVRDSLDADIDSGIRQVTVSFRMQTAGRVFVDRLTLAVPQSTTGVEQQPPLPASCILHQNYPNPFNPSSTIRFDLPRSMTVSLIVTDALGRELIRLLDHAVMQSGLNTVRYDARSIPSGVYFYRLETPDGMFVRKMVLVR